MAPSTSTVEHRASPHKDLAFVGSWADYDLNHPDALFDVNKYAAAKGMQPSSRRTGNHASTLHAQSWPVTEANLRRHVHASLGDARHIIWPEYGPALDVWLLQRRETEPFNMLTSPVRKPRVCSKEDESLWDYDTVLPRTEGKPLAPHQGSSDCRRGAAYRAEGRPRDGIRTR